MGRRVPWALEELGPVRAEHDSGTGVVATTEHNVCPVRPDALCVLPDSFFEGRFVFLGEVTFADHRSQAAHEDAFELNAVGSAVGLAHVVDDAVLVGELEQRGVRDT